MSASKCGQRAVNRGEIGLQTDHASLKSSPSEIECINSRCGGCYADLSLGRKGFAKIAKEPPEEAFFEFSASSAKSLRS